MPDDFFGALYCHRQHARQLNSAIYPTKYFSIITSMSDTYENSSLMVSDVPISIFGYRHLLAL
jgi:hypothetical protein